MNVSPAHPKPSGSNFWLPFGAHFSFFIPCSFFSDSTHQMSFLSQGLCTCSSPGSSNSWILHVYQKSYIHCPLIACFPFNLVILYHHHANVLDSLTAPSVIHEPVARASLMLFMSLCTGLWGMQNPRPHIRPNNQNLRFNNIPKRCI